MKQIIFILLLVTAALVPIFSDTAESEPLILTVADAVKLGLANNYNLKVQASNVAGKNRAKDDAWNVFLPDISASLTFSRKNTATITSFGQEMSPWTAVGNLSAQLALSPAMFNGVKQLELDLNNALLDLESAEQSTEKSIKTNFYNLLLLQEQIDVLNKNIETTKSRLKSMEEMYEYGYVTELDLLNTKAGLASMGPSLLQMENGYKQLQMVILMDLGLPLNREVVLEGSVDVAPETWDADSLVSNNLANRIDIQQLTIAGEILGNAKSATFNQSLLPALILGWSYSPYQSDPFETETWGDDGYFGDNGSLSLTLSLPVEDWIPHSGTYNKIQDAQDQIERMAYQKELAFLGAEMEIRSLAMTLNTSIESLKVLSESIDINRQSFDMSMESYNSGQLSLLDLETSENSLLQAELDLVSEKYKYISSLLNLEAAINKNLTK
ncbi:MAG: TolC family protein [Spirochaetales bacterium]|nr:TolC family protein [Spirochaetales bacterium]